ncbi:ribonuclease R [Gammaproteobacteria bacterium 45_16_T64]|nr:ribonuclease R [Gammaproteobacteria bacterium 45_16_T64]
MAKWSPNKDPNAEQEAQKYENPVPSREFILSLLENEGGPLTHRQVCMAFDLYDDDAVEGVRRRLRAMERDGQLMSTRRGAYGILDKMDLITGTIIGHKDGFGFLKPDGGTKDLFLSARQMRLVFDGDRVVARESADGWKGKKEAAIVEVLERKTLQIVGRFFKDKHASYASPENKRNSQDILIQPGAEHGAKNGQFVVVAIIEQPTMRHQAVGEVVDILGDHMAPGMEIDVAIRNHDIPNEWPEEVTAAAQQWGATVDESEAAHRIDLRDLPLITIDGEDARDFDDAVYCVKKPKGGWRLYVAIADVSHYVHPGAPLDLEAHKRGNSVYFPEHVVPMLPETLSNGLCSLNPNVDRLVMVCEMSVSAAGKVSRYCFYEGIIRSHARLTYTKVGALLNKPDSTLAGEVREQYSGVVPVVEELNQLYLKLREQRTIRGAIDFETTETRIVFGEDRKIEKIVPVQRNDAHRLIEECMLAANVATARFLEKHKLSALYRNHDVPKDKKLEKLRAFLKELSIEFDARKKPKPSDYQRVMEQIQGRPDANLIQTVLLRSMNQAVYSPENIGHFGLAYTAYAHFTSPIRRYPDLLVHRALRYQIRSGQESTNVKMAPGAQVLAKKEWLPYSDAQMIELGESCSHTERRADEATWDVVGWLKCEYMQDKVDEEFTGIITAVTSFGLFVELNEVYVEGLVHISSLSSDYYHFDDVRHRLTGEASGVIFGLGDTVSVRVAKVDLDDRKIDFELQDGGRKNRWAKKSGNDGDKKTAKGKKSGSKKPNGKSKKAGAKPTGGGARGAGTKKATAKKVAGKSANDKAEDDQVARKPKKKSTKASGVKKAGAKKPGAKTGSAKKAPKKKAAKRIAKSKAGSTPKGAKSQ